jgi:hypothetical protein
MVWYPNTRVALRSRVSVCSEEFGTQKGKSGQKVVFVFIPL